MTAATTNGGISPGGMTTEMNKSTEEVNSSTIATSRESALEDQQLNPAKIFVGGLGPRTTSSSLQEYFSRFGKVRDAAVVEDRISGRSRGFGFIVFCSEQSAQECVAETRHTVDGISCEVRRAVPREDARNNQALETGGCKVYVGGLRESITESMLKEYFETRCGPIQEVTIMLDRISRKPRGFAFVIFTTPADATKAFGPHPELGPSAEAKIAEPRSASRRYGGRGGALPPGSPAEYYMGSGSTAAPPYGHHVAGGMHEVISASWGPTHRWGPCSPARGAGGAGTWVAPGVHAGYPPNVADAYYHHHHHDTSPPQAYLPQMVNPYGLESSMRLPPPGGRGFMESYHPHGGAYHHVGGGAGGDSHLEWGRRDSHYAASGGTPVRSTPAGRLASRRFASPY